VVSSPPLLDTSLPGLTLHRRGKVRDVYEVDAQHLLIVATDRISAFDYVLGSGIPDKGRVLTQLSAFWFEELGDLVAHHVLATDVADYPPALAAHADLLRGRSMLVRRTEPLAIECVARGYLSGSGWKDYRATGRVCGIELPPDLRESDQLPEAIFTPATKAASGHDENITKAEAAALVGDAMLARLEDLTLKLYARGADYARARGIILADTKFEFGLLPGATVASTPPEPILIDECMTPDSSRFWPADTYRPGGPQASFDKQFVRDYLESIRWNKQPPVPSLPDDVVARTRDKYLDAFHRLTGRELR
jgi:phosphoribosylaminoimidazole-succinocarboxamide synthase